jgi:tetratricopeptide (TPR) repeat protein
MFRRILAAALIALAASLPAQAATGGAQSLITAHAIAAMSLDELFARLKDNPDGAVGARIEQEILARFNHSGSPTADLLFSWANDAVEAKDYRHALDILDQILVIKPDFAEAWNKRAAVYYQLDDYSAALADLRATLKLEPRHFGALTGFGTILQVLDRKQEAERVFRRALELDPRLDNVKETLKSLEKETGGSSI